MSTQRSVIEKKAYGIAAANFLSFDDSAFDADPYLAYLEYESAVDDKREPNGLEVWVPFESYDDVLTKIGELAEHILSEMNDILRLAHRGIINETIEMRIDSDMNMLDLDLMIRVGDTLEKGGSVEALYDDEDFDDEVASKVEPPSSEDLDQELDVELRRYEVGVTRIAHSSEKQFTVLAAGKEEAEAKALELAYDAEFSCGDAQYECDAQAVGDKPIPSGAVVTWRDPTTGEDQDVIFRKTHGEVVMCHTMGGGELEAFSAELH